MNSLSNYLRTKLRNFLQITEHTVIEIPNNPPPEPIIKTTLVDELEHSLLNNSHQWIADKHNAKNEHLKIELWIANGADHLKVNSNDILKKEDKIRLWAAFEKLTENNLLKLIKESNSNNVTTLQSIIIENEILKKENIELKKENMQYTKYRKMEMITNGN
jgi:hypothetical protein